jgi:hypothetical protein
MSTVWYYVYNVSEEDGLKIYWTVLSLQKYSVSLGFQNMPDQTTDLYDILN